jgi:5-methylcytosine-specific restriction endonuclease McrA
LKTKVSNILGQFGYDIRDIKFFGRCRKLNWRPKSSNKIGSKLSLLKLVQKECSYCGKTIKDKEHTIDHIIPVSRNGLNSWENLMLVCQSCNTKKGNKTLLEFMGLLSRKQRINRGKENE